MDSLTQIVLGAAVGEAVLGKKVGNKALLWGAVAGTIPDLDVLVKLFTDGLRANELHRGFSHSILFCVLFAPVFGYIVNRFYKHQGETNFKGWSKLFFWGLFTHPLLDAFTTWGTQLFWPMEYKVSFRNIFVIDPLYTVPFLICTIAVLFYKRTDIRRRKWNWWGIKVSSSYMLITLLFKWYAYGKFEQSLDRQNITYNKIQTKPTPLNTILWSVNVQRENEYKIGHYSLLDKDDSIQYTSYPKNLYLIKGYEENSYIKRLIKLAQGWYTITKEGDVLYFNDLRFGALGMANKESKFVFRYKLIFNSNNELIDALVQDPNSEKMKPLLNQLIERVKGNK
jgi:inner membrane protein